MSQPVLLRTLVLSLALFVVVLVVLETQFPRIQIDLLQPTDENKPIEPIEKEPESEFKPHKQDQTNNTLLVDPETLPPGIILDAHTKYIFVAGWYGRFANNLNMLRNSLHMAKTLNRTLLLGSRTPQGFGFQNIFNFSKIRSNGFRVEFHINLHKSKFDTELFPRAKSIKPFSKFIEHFRADERQLLVLHSYTPFYHCIDREASSALWNLFEPSAEYSAALSHIKQELGLSESPKAPYMGIHLRKMEKECLYQTEKHFAKSSFESISSMCTGGWDHVVKAKEYFQLDEGVKVVVASDGQDGERDDEMRSKGAKLVDWGWFKDSFRYGNSTVTDGNRLFIPALDFMLMWDADVFVGNSASSFSSGIAELRVSRVDSGSNGSDSMGNRNVMAFPPEDMGFSVNGFWKCVRFMSWCWEGKGLPTC